MPPRSRTGSGTSTTSSSGKSDGLFYHGKGATPAFDNWADDATDLTLIPLNMAEPMLIVRGKNAAHGLGFSPHGAGRNFSRTPAPAHAGGAQRRRDLRGRRREGIDARFFSGVTDISELPSAYKNAAAVRRQIEQLRPGRSGRRGDALRLHHGRRLGGQRALAQEAGKQGGGSMSRSGCPIHLSVRRPDVRASNLRRALA